MAEEMKFEGCEYWIGVLDCILLLVEEILARKEHCRRDEARNPSNYRPRSALQCWLSKERAPGNFSKCSHTVSVARLSEICHARIVGYFASGDTEIIT